MHQRKISGKPIRIYKIKLMNLRKKLIIITQQTSKLIRQRNTNRYEIEILIDTTEIQSKRSNQ